MRKSSRLERTGERKTHFATEERGCRHIAIFFEHDNFSENVLKYNSTLLMRMWTAIETFKANRVSLLVFLAQNKTLRVKV